MKNIFPPKIQKVLGIFLITIVVFPMVAIPRPAQAIPVAVIADDIELPKWVWEIGNFVEKITKEGAPGQGTPAQFKCAIVARTLGLIPPSVPPGIADLVATSGGVDLTNFSDNEFLGCIAGNTAVAAESAKKEEALNGIWRPIARAIIRMVIQELKRNIINFILTGDLQGPTFVTSFIGDPKLAAENAIRGYLSQITNINFCNFFPPVIQANYSLSLNLQLQCISQRKPHDVIQAALTNIFSFDPVTRATLSMPQYNYAQVVADILAGKTNRAAEAAVALLADATTGGGYISLKSPRFGSRSQTITQKVPVQTDVPCQEGDTPGVDCGTITETQTVDNTITLPGQTIGEMVNQSLGQTFQGLNTGREVDDAIVEISTVAVGSLINGGINTLFGR